jgi:hypothetical protein
MSAIGPYLQLALEQAPNYEGGSSAVSSNVFYPPLETIKDDDKPTMLEEQNVIRGFLARMPHLGVAEYNPDWQFGKIHARPSHLGFFLAAMLGSWTTTAGNGTTVTDPDAVAVPTGAYKHVFTFRFATEPQTLQAIACSGDGKHRKATGVALNDLAFSWQNGAMVLDPTALALYTGDIADPSVTPVVDLTMPFRQGDMTLTWLGSSALTRAFDFKFNAPLETVRSPVHASLYPTDVWYKNGELPYVSGKISKATLEAADLAALYAGGQFAAMIKIVHRQQIGSTGYMPKMWVDMPGCELVGITRDDIKAERRREGSYTWESRFDHTTGNLVTVTLVNDTAAYATF